MKTLASIGVILCLLSLEARAEGYGYGGYQYGYPSRHDDGDFYRMERNVRDLKRQQQRQLNQCQTDLRRQQQSYMELLSRQQGLGASVDSLRNENAALSEDRGDSGIPRPGPSKAEYDDLQERYETLLSAYRELERAQKSP